MEIQEMINWHGDQQWSIYPYSQHLYNVNKIAQELNKDKNIDEKIVEQAAYSHDLLEDTKVNEKMLPESIRESIVLVSRNLSQGELSYQQYIRKIAISNDSLAIMIKLADAIVNWSLSKKSHNTLIQRYEKSIPVLYQAFCHQDCHWDIIEKLSQKVELP